jgi:hypothetical protein
MEVLWRQVIDRRDVLPRDDEEVHRRTRMPVLDRRHQRILQRPTSRLAIVTSETIEQ